jgi:hypothetical protein
MTYTNKLHWYDISFEDDHYKGDAAVRAFSLSDAIDKFKEQHPTLAHAKFTVRWIDDGS